MRMRVISFLFSWCSRSRDNDGAQKIEGCWTGTCLLAEAAEQVLRDITMNLQPLELFAQQDVFEQGDVLRDLVWLVPLEIECRDSYLIHDFASVKMSKHFFS